MGFLDSVLGSALGHSRQAQAGAGQAPASGGAAAALLPVVLAMLAGQQGSSRNGGQGGMLGGLLGGNAGSGSGGLGSLIGGLLGGSSNSAGGAGGLGSLLEKFSQAGLGEQVKSWVGTGENLPVSPDAIGQVFGRDAIAKIAQQAGLSQEETSSGLSQVLPEVVDRLTPEGKLPDFAQLAQSVTAFREKLGA